MSHGFFIVTIAQVLTLCGIVSIRMFLPTFLYYLSLRLALAFPDFAPSLIENMASKVPDWQISNVFLGITGVLAALELIAVRIPELKQFLTQDIDRYAKPLVSVFLAFSLMNSAQADGVNELLQQSPQIHEAGFNVLALVVGLIAGGYTYLMSQVRDSILSVTYTIDPDGSLGLQKLANYAEEILLLLIMFILVVIPVLALFICLFGLILRVICKTIAARLNKKHSHLCPHCLNQKVETLVSNCAINCQVCGGVQPYINCIGWFGFCSKKPLGYKSLTTHGVELLSVKRCRWCAQPLKKSTVCDCCGKLQWDDQVLLRQYLKRTDIRCFILVGIALLSFLFPIVGCVLVLILFRPLVLRPLTIHLNTANRLWTSFLWTWLKLLFAIILILLATVPMIGVLFIVPFIIQYLVIRKKFCNIAKMGC